MMANPMRGEAMLGEHKLVCDFNGWCSLEAATGRTVPELIAMMKSGVGFGYREMRTFVRCFSESQMTEAEAGDLISSLGMIEIEETLANGKKRKSKVWAAAEALGKAVEGFFAPPKEIGDRPLKAA